MDSSCGLKIARATSWASMVPRLEEGGMRLAQAHGAPVLMLRETRLITEKQFEAELK